MTQFNNNAFDSAAQTYDEIFTYSKIGSKQRKRVYYWLNKIHFFNTPKKVFEINCGTGYDAEQFTLKGHSVIATDRSEKMIAFAQSNRNKTIDFSVMDFSRLATNEKLSDSEVLFSNFGGLNCISSSELDELVIGIAEKQKSKDLLIWVLMPKFCLSETMYFFLKFKFGKLFRRFSKNAVQVKTAGININTYYHSPLSVKKKLKNFYNISLVKPVAVFLPPSYTEQFFRKHKKLLNLLSKLEKIFGRFTFLAAWADHYIIIAEKR